MQIWLVFEDIKVVYLMQYGGRLGFMVRFKGIVGEQLEVGRKFK